MKLKTSKKFTAILTSILATFAVYTGALAIFLYVQGWRVDLLDQSIKQVGVLTVESSPTQANIYVNEQLRGRTNRSMTLDVGEYDLRVSKEGYYDWEKQVKILEEKSTPVFPYLIMTEFEEAVIYKSELTLEKHWSDKYNNRLLLLLRNDTSFQLVQYHINNGFWALNTAPSTILTIPVAGDEENPITDVNLQLSPSGEFAILELITTQSSSKYVIPTTRSINYTTVIQEPLSLADFQNYELIWANNEEYLILESDTDVISYDLNKNTRHLLFRKVDPLDVWDTDVDGYFYIFRHIESANEDILEYTLKQYNLDGSAETTVIPSVYFQTNTQFIENYRAADFNFVYFTNSPESTQTIGEITKFTVNHGVKGLYITTTEASYWFDTTIGKYFTVSPYPAELLQFSPDGHKFLIKTDSNYSMFVFDKEEGDHTTTIGAHPIKNLNYDLVKRINWLSNSSYFQYEEDEFIYISDMDGDNKTPLISNENIVYWTVNSSRDELITLTTSEELGLQIISYAIH